MPAESPTRRTVLRTAAAGAAATGFAGTALAEPTGRTLVGLQPGSDASVATTQAESVHRELDFGDIGRVVAGTFSDNAISALQNNPNVRYVEKEGRMHALAQDVPYGIDIVEADVAHDNGETGAGADIAIVDTGIDQDHPDLQANLGNGADFTGTGSWDDDNGHGTHCAGIANADDNTEGVVGVSTEATLHAAKVLDSGGGGNFSDIAAGVEWVANQGYDVASLSLGGSTGSSALEDACQYATNNGVLVVAAAGNDGECSDCVSYPAAYDTVMAVSATDSNDDIASFSSTGPEIDIAAPGAGVYSTYNDGGYTSLDGTSMACPHVAGAGGQLMANGYSNTDARQQLTNTADDICRCSDDAGAGRLNVAAALGLQSPSNCSGTTECQNDSGGGGGCFITTATAGEGPTLDSLRRFRDESMAATPVGRGMVGLYYRISPPIADTLERHPESLTTRATRKIVDVCASLSDRQDETDSPVESASLGVTLTALYMVGITVGASGHFGIRMREQLDRTE
ncbi:subtilisin-like serine protease [Halovivax ruber XH-70]|uniref:Subtilisin-like serine protease n=1 Tax=Halovivax ruber (strain DSM 18193 / JCM 13892 / XH-70) TaxID=797302 RepID=L0IAY3_HALRX|nr:S8 family peptidase [Halovivax ruber]AGB15117.1 subtilisin-like serine protease [Halovivax ruber XH-70]